MMTSRVHSWNGARATRLGVITARTYRIGATARVEPIVAAHERSSEVLPDEGSALQTFERPLTDVLLEGSAYSHRGSVTELTTGIAVGDVRKQVRVRGDRRVRIGARGELRATSADGFVNMPLDWTRAYGGRDRAAEELQRAAPDPPPEVVWGAFAYPRNTEGRGFWASMDVDRLEGELLPNLDDPDDPVEPQRLLADDALDWIDRPAAAAYCAIDELTFPRCVFYLLRPDWRAPKRPVYEVRMGMLQERDLHDRPIEQPPDPRIFNHAPAGLAMRLLRGAERVSLWNLHPEHELLEFDLPAERPRLLVEPPGTRTFELEAQLKTVLVQPDENLVTLTWAGAMDVAAVYPAAMCREMRHAAAWER